MITSNYQVDGDIYSYADKFYCDSRDDKPSNADARDGLINGAILEETDTGKTYIFDKKANEWTEKATGGGGGGGSTTLAGLTDVDISNLSNGQTLVYNSTSDKWENGSGSDSSVLMVIDTAGTLNVTADELAAAANSKPVFVKYLETDATRVLLLNAFSVAENDYLFSFGGNLRTYVATAGTDYPTMPL